ncbi:MAG: magnesium-translocating P-type ATPase [Chloroflexi bacterium]|nr:magnesium-translocating P-type ATPase [Chloroflexota bacterium]
MGLIGRFLADATRLAAAARTTGNDMRVSQVLVESARATAGAVLEKLHTTASGLTSAEALLRQKQYGANEVAREKYPGLLERLWTNVKNPLVILLAVLALVSYLTGDVRSTVVISLMVVLGIVLRYVQEMRADHAAERLQAMVKTTTTVLRDGDRRELPLQELVPGDIVMLSAGDMVPADARLLTAKDLFLNQAALTGESMPVEKTAAAAPPEIQNPLEMPDICFLGSDVESGSATAVVVHTGHDTYFGSLAASIVGERQLTSFDKGVNGFTWLMIGFIAVMTPTVFILNGLSKGNWIEAFLFGLAVAVGLTPEMLPMIVTMNLSKGAIEMARHKVIVKRLNAIQNFGAMDMLCTDKTGTITQGRIILEKHLDASGQESDEMLEYGYLNSYYQTGLKNLMDVAVLDHTHLEEQVVFRRQFRKVDEIPFDFKRKRMSVVVAGDDGVPLLICKGAVEEVLDICNRVEVRGQVLPRLPEHDQHRRTLVDRLNMEGFRVIALAYKMASAVETGHAFTVSDENDMVLKGFLAFLDPPKDSVLDALAQLKQYNVGVRILTGDNELVTRTICRQVGLIVDQVMLGPAIEALNDAQLAAAIEGTTIFAKLSPAHKERIIHALQANGHVVGFLGDGINDAPALKAADVGISVDSAVDMAKESSDIILLETSLLVLVQGVIEGRRVFGNITKYIRMAASSNFGNMFSVVGASIFLPFLPMLPIQVLLNNLLYDFSQTSIPTDSVDAEWLARPRKWALGELRRFIVLIGPISSIFDYLTFGIMLWVFDAWSRPELFHTGWFVESLFTQTLIIHVIRTNKIPFLQSRASGVLMTTSLVIVAIGAWLTVSPFADPLGFVVLPPLYWLLLAVMLLAYVVLTQWAKGYFIRRYGE